MNKKIKQINFGSPLEVLQLIEQPQGILAKDKVRIRMIRANINPSDILSICGIGQYQRYHQPPRIPGFEGVGIVEVSNNDQVKPGQKVVVTHSGTWQKYIDLSIEDFLIIPTDITNDYASQLYINGLTAWGITQSLQLDKRHVVLINAASSAIGKLFSQLSKAMGFTVIGLTSRPQYCCKHCHYILDTRKDITKQWHILGIPAPNVILDAVGGIKTESLLQFMQKDSIFLTYGSFSLQPFSSNFYKMLKEKSINFQYFFLRDWEQEMKRVNRNKSFYKMLRFFLKHQIEFDTAKIIPIEEYEKAFSLILSRKLTGKVLFSF